MKINNKKEDKWNKIEELFKEDCANGNHILKKVQSRLKKKGMCPLAILKELELLKDS